MFLLACFHQPTTAPSHYVSTKSSEYIYKVYDLISFYKVCSDRMRLLNWESLDPDCCGPRLTAVGDQSRSHVTPVWDEEIAKNVGKV